MMSLMNKTSGQKRAQGPFNRIEIARVVFWQLTLRGIRPRTLRPGIPSSSCASENAAFLELGYMKKVGYWHSDNRQPRIHSTSSTFRCFQAVWWLKESASTSVNDIIFQTDVVWFLYWNGEKVTISVEEDNNALAQLLHREGWKKVLCW